jgi:hypothetical protein
VAETAALIAEDAKRRSNKLPVSLVLELAAACEARPPTQREPDPPTPLAACKLSLHQDAGGAERGTLTVQVTSHGCCGPSWHADVLGGC